MRQQDCKGFGIKQIIKERRLMNIGITRASHRPACGSLTMVDKNDISGMMTLLVMLAAFAFLFLTSQALAGENPGEIVARVPRDLPLMGAERVWIAVGGVFFLIILIAIAWHYVSLMRLNRRLLDSLEKQKASEKALRESETIFNQFLEHSPIYLFFKDENIRTIKLSKNYEKMLGMPIESMMGKTMDDLFPSDLAKSMVEDDKKIVREGKTIEVMEEFNGRAYSTVKFPIVVDGKPKFLAGFTMDISERRRPE